MTVLLALIAAAALTAPAQPPPPAPAPSAPAAPAAPAAPRDSPPAPPPDYRYAPEGRRDPFVSLVNRGTDASGSRPLGTRPEGLEGVLVEEAAVRGILESRGGYFAILAAPNGRTYTARPGDRLLDGSISRIDAGVVVFLQEVNDPLSLDKQREVRKPLRPEVK